MADAVEKVLRLAPNSDSADLRVMALEAAMMGRRRGDRVCLRFMNGRKSLMTVAYSPMARASRRFIGTF